MGHFSFLTDGLPDRGPFLQTDLITFIHELIHHNSAATTCAGGRLGELRGTRSNEVVHTILLEFNEILIPPMF